MKSLTTILIISLLASFPAKAAWELDSEKSTLTFVSIKAIHIAEVHKFTNLSGGMDAQGKVSIKIGLNSVDTGIDIRDERMRNMLFDTGTYESATISADVDPAKLAILGSGEVMELAIEGVLSLHGQSNSLSAEVVVANIGGTTLLVTSKKPVVVNAFQFQLEEGVEALREIAGLPSISLAVPVNFVFQFDSI